MDKKEIKKVVMQDLETMKVVSLLGTETYVKKQEVIDLIDWLDDVYTVEKEPMYIVMDKLGFPILAKLKGEVHRVTTIYEVDSARWKRDKDQLLLTEKEIKDYDERYWPFAVKVEDE